VGLFTSFAAFPVLGWAIIGLAIICGSILAYQAILRVQDEFQKSEFNQITKKMHQQLSKAVLKRNLDAEIHDKVDTLVTGRQKESSRETTMHDTKGDSKLSFRSFFSLKPIDVLGHEAQTSANILTG